MSALDEERWLEECAVCGIAVRDWVFCPGGGYLCPDCDDDQDWDLADEDDDI